MAEKENLQPKVGAEVTVTGVGNDEAEQTLVVTHVDKPKVLATVGNIQLVEKKFTLSPKAPAQPSDREQ